MTKLSRRAFLSAVAATSGYATWALHSSPAHAYQVTLLPASPQLGDTLSVFIVAEFVPAFVYPAAAFGHLFPLTRSKRQALEPFK